MSMTGWMRRSASSGQTLASSAAAIAALNSTGAGPERRAGMDEPLDHQLGEIGAADRAALRGDLDDAAFDRRRVVVARDIVAADHVEDDVGAAARRSLP